MKDPVVGAAPDSGRERATRWAVAAQSGEGVGLHSNPLGCLRGPVCLAGAANGVEIAAVAAGFVGPLDRDGLAVLTSQVEGPQEAHQGEGDGD